MMRMGICGNMNVDTPLFTDQTWRRGLADRIMPCVALPFVGREKCREKAKLTEKDLSETSFFSGRVEVISQELEMQRTGK